MELNRNDADERKKADFLKEYELLCKKYGMLIWADYSDLYSFNVFIADENRIEEEVKSLLEEPCYKFEKGQ